MKEYKIIIKRTKVNEIYVMADSRKEAIRKVQSTIDNSTLLDNNIMNKVKDKIEIKTKYVNE